MSNCERPRRLDIERLFAGEMDEINSGELKEHLAGCAVCGSYHESLRREREQFLKMHPFTAAGKIRNIYFKPEPLSGKIRRFIESATRPALIPAYGFILILAIITPVLLSRMTAGRQDADTVTYKGGRILSFICDRDGQVHEGDPSALYYAGDKIQILYNSDKDRFLTLFSVDNGGSVSFYQPDPKDRNCSIASGKGASLTYPSSIRLDSALGAELIIALFTPGPVAADEIRAWIEPFVNAPAADIKTILVKIRKHPFSPETIMASLILRKGER